MGLKVYGKVDWGYNSSFIINAFAKGLETFATSVTESWYYTKNVTLSLAVG